MFSSQPFHLINSLKSRHKFWKHNYFQLLSWLRCPYFVSLSWQWRSSWWSCEEQFVWLGSSNPSGSSVNNIGCHWPDDCPLLHFCDILQDGFPCHLTGIPARFVFAASSSLHIWTRILFKNGKIKVEISHHILPFWRWESAIQTWYWIKAKQPENKSFLELHRGGAQDSPTKYYGQLGHPVQFNQHPAHCLCLRTNHKQSRPEPEESD